MDSGSLRGMGWKSLKGTSCMRWGSSGQKVRIYLSLSGHFFVTFVSLEGQPRGHCIIFFLIYHRGIHEGTSVCVWGGGSLSLHISLSKNTSNKHNLSPGGTLPLTFFGTFPDIWLYCPVLAYMNLRRYQKTETYIAIAWKYCDMTEGLTAQP